MQVSRSIGRRDKWYFLRLGASWDRAVVPIYEDAASGKYVPLLKPLLTSHCKNECAYCTFRAGRQCPRIVWKHKELAEFTVQLWRERKISGLFRSSSVSKDPDCVTKMQLDVLRVLRRNGYSGYVHLRIMSGASPYYIRGAVELADRVGVNLEAPNKDVFSELCPDKGGFKETVIKRLASIANEVQRARRVTQKPKFGFARAGVDTQMIVGATDDNDWQYFQVTEWLYKRQGLKRVYYSGFEPIAQKPLEKRRACPSMARIPPLPVLLSHSRLWSQNRTFSSNCERLGFSAKPIPRGRKKRKRGKEEYTSKFIQYDATLLSN